MRKLFAPIALALMVGTTGIAFAASPTPAVKPPVTAPMLATTSISSTVKAFDLKAHTLTLANNIVYKLPMTFTDPGLKTGAKVTVQWRMNGKEYEADSVKLG